MSEENSIPVSHELTLRKYFNSGAPSLPSNFSWRVMQSVYEMKLKQARQRATLESVFVTLISSVALVVVLGAYFAYTGSFSWSLPTEGGFALPALLTLGGYLLLDAALGVFRQSRQAS